jgi:hypothetical protein
LSSISQQIYLTRIRGVFAFFFSFSQISQFHYFLHNKHFKYTKVLQNLHSPKKNWFLNHSKNHGHETQKQKQKKNIMISDKSVGKIKKNKNSLLNEGKKINLIITKP